ncbi:hypothetical protein LXA43DRAFT_1057809 [Ganoderma leucocontextum]|nr:hypothetical protein LXA43DRAFT_1057809 [Ganoderma leucocontextum]
MLSRRGLRPGWGGQLRDKRSTNDRLQYGRTGRTGMGTCRRKYIMYNYAAALQRAARRVLFMCARRENKSSNQEKEGGNLGSSANFCQVRSAWHSHQAPDQTDANCAPPLDAQLGLKPGLKVYSLLRYIPGCKPLTILWHTAHHGSDPAQRTSSSQPIHKCSSHLTLLRPALPAQSSRSKVIQRETFKVRHSTITVYTTIMSKSSEPRMPVEARDKPVVKAPRYKPLATKTCILRKHPAEASAEHEEDARTKAKKRKVASSEAPAPVPAPQIVPSSKVQEILQSMEKLKGYAVNIRAAVSSLEHVNADVEDLLDNINQLDKDIETVKAELGVVSNNVANMADDLKRTKLEVVKVKELVEHVDAQLEQERELRYAPARRASSLFAHCSPVANTRHRLVHSRHRDRVKAMVSRNLTVWHNTLTIHWIKAA